MTGLLSRDNDGHDIPPARSHLSAGLATDIAIGRAKYILSWQRINAGDAEGLHRAI